MTVALVGKLMNIYHMIERVYTMVEMLAIRLDLLL